MRNTIKNLWNIAEIRAVVVLCAIGYVPFVFLSYVHSALVAK